MPAAVLEAFRAAAAECVRLDELQAAASRQIARLTGAEAGLVTAGAAAALTLGAAAVLAGHDPGRMERLPHSDGFANEFVVAREQRNAYDHAVRAAGARLVEVGFDELAAGSGVRRAEAWTRAACRSWWTPLASCRRAPTCERSCKTGPTWSRSAAARRCAGRRRPGSCAAAAT
jgi:L-seryl-tRNA(Ser) seleniumtransferase